MAFSFAIKRTWVLPLLLFCLNAESETSFTTSQFKVADHILISRNLSYPANHLCHDQRHLFFKSKSSCTELNSELSNCDDLKVAPIRQLERIHFSEEQSLVRVFSIELTHKVRIYEKVEPNQNEFALVKRIENQEVPLCDASVPLQEPEVIYSEREAYDDKEREILGTFARSGFPLFKSPAGRIHNLNMIDDAGLNLNRDLINHHELNLRISSALCSRTAARGVLKRISGEFSGNSMPHCDFDLIQKFSNSLVETIDVSGETVMECSNQIWI